MFFKKKSNPGKGSNLKNPNEFMLDVYTEFQERAHSKGYLQGAAPFVPEIMQKGTFYTLDWLRNDAFARQCQNDAITLYHNIAVFSFLGGAYHAYIWHTDFKSFQNDDLTKILYQKGVTSLAGPVISIGKEPAMNFSTELFKRFFEMIQPYHQSMQNYAPYIQSGMMAFFQLGAGIQLQSMGFK